MKVRSAGTGSVFSAASTAATRNVWVPFCSGSTVCGSAQSANAPPSTEHTKFPPPSSEENPNSGVRSEIVEPSAGPSPIVVSGASASARKRATIMSELLPPAETILPSGWIATPAPAGSALEPVLEAW